MNRGTLKLRTGGRRGSRLPLALSASALWALTLAPAAAAESDRVLVTRVSGPITPVIADHLDDTLREAEQGGYGALVIELDTPGGLDTSMRDIVKDIFVADVPVIVYVAPQGGRAASAGAIITLAAHIAVMAPGTTIGAATPVALEGGEVIDKVINDAAAYVEEIAAERGRDVDFAVATVREGRAVGAQEALEIGAVDLIASSLEQLLDEVDGRSVRIGPQGDEVTLATSGAQVEQFDMAFVRRILQAVADPNLAFLFLSIGGLAILYELANPGAGIGGVLGAIMLVLAFFSLSVLPTDIAGVLLIVLALALFVAELFVPGIGVFAAGGALALILGGLFLFPEPTGIGVDLSVLLPVPVLVALGAVLVGRLVWRTQRASAEAGIVGQIPGEYAEVRSAVGRDGQAMVGGSLWSVRSEGESLEVGQRVRILRREGLQLFVEPPEEGQPDA
ncbi:MAG TPA: nodulation protein NfeD [Egibacteraceae bacterium]|nr:nodulation protein NfeD [Egibacteraceae bacterium]